MEAAESVQVCCGSDEEAEPFFQPIGQTAAYEVLATALPIEKELWEREVRERAFKALCDTPKLRELWAADSHVVFQQRARAFVETIFGPEEEGEQPEPSQERCGEPGITAIDQRDVEPLVESVRGLLQDYVDGPEGYYPTLGEPQLTQLSEALSTFKGEQ